MRPTAANFLGDTGILADMDPAVQISVSFYLFFGSIVIFLSPVGTNWASW